MRRSALAFAFSAALALSAHGAERGVLPVIKGQHPTDAQVIAAVEVVKADPNFNAHRTIKSLRWASKPTQSGGGMPGWIAWLGRLFGWIGSLFAWVAQSSRFLVWVVAAVLAALLVIYLTRLVRTRGLPRTDGRFVAPSHVRDLDIRPESLPEDIGGAARALWDRGEQRAALALLYRGLLSRLVHVHRVPIRDSSTEGDCLALARAKLDEERNLYASNLVRVWLRAVYGREEVDAAQVYALCDGFASALNAKAEPIGIALGARQPA